MQHAISGRLAQARLADLRQDAQRGTIARAARRARPRRPGRAGSVWPALDRRVRRKPSPRTVLAIASLSGAIAFIDATIVNIAFPDIAHSFPGTPISALSWVLNAYNIVFAAFLMAAAGLADVLGRRRVFIFGLALFTAGSLLCAIAPSADTLIAFRVIQALGAAFLVPSALALVLNAFPPARRSHAVALLSAVSAAAAGLGPSLGGLLVAAANWRLVFLVNIPIGVAAILLARQQLAESRAPGRHRVPDLSGTLLFAAAIGTLVLGVVKGQDWGWGSPRILGCLTAALGLGAAVIWRCGRQRWPILDLSLLKIRTFSVANAMTVIGAAGFFGYTLANVLFLTGVWRYSVLQAGLALTIGPAVAVAVAGPTSRLAQRLGPRPVLVVGGLVWGGAVLWFVERVGVTPDFAGQWLPGMILLGIGAGTLFPNLSGAAVASAPGGSFATATGMNSVARQIGAALGVAVVVAIIGTPTPATAYAVFHDAWTFGAICLFVAGLGCLFVGHVKVGEVPAAGEDARGDAAGGDAARAALADIEPQGILRSPRPRPRRAVVLDTGDPVASGAEPVASGAESAAEFLARTPLFSGVDSELVEQLAAKSRAHHLDAGKWLFRERDPGHEMYVVRAGRLEAVDEGAGAVLREYRRGDALGEVALLTDSPRAASVRAARGTEVIAVDQADFTDLLHSSPAASLALNRSLSRRLQDTRAGATSARPRPTTVALIALDWRIPLERLAARLGAALGAYLSVAVLGAAEVPDAAGPDEPAAVYGPLLDRAESGHDMVLLVGGFGLGKPWTKFCLQHADRILAVTAGGRVPQALGLHPELQGCDLVVHDAEPGTLDGWAAVLEAGRVAPDSGNRVRRRHGPYGPPTGRHLGRDRTVRRRRPGVLPHRRARGADRRGRNDQPHRRGQHGRRDRRAVRDGPRRRRDRRDLLRGVGAAQAAARLHPPPPRADPRRAVPVDAAPHLRHPPDRGTAAQLHVRQRRTAQRTSGDRAVRAAVGGGRVQHQPAGHCASAGSRPQDAHRRFAGRQPAGEGDGRDGRRPDHRDRREGDAQAPEKRPGGGTRTRRPAAAAWLRRSPGCCYSAARTRPKRPAVTPTW